VGCKTRLHTLSPCFASGSATHRSESNEPQALVNERLAQGCQPKRSQFSEFGTSHGPRGSASAGSSSGSTLRTSRNRSYQGDRPLARERIAWRLLSHATWWLQGAVTAGTASDTRLKQAGCQCLLFSAWMLEQLEVVHLSYTTTSTRSPTGLHWHWHSQWQLQVSTSLCGGGVSAPI